MPYSVHGAANRFPASGNRNGTDVNNVGNNGNYWSATPNDENNAWNLNFNSNEANMNNNNRNNGQAVRLVQHLPLDDTLLTDLFRAYYSARRNKRNTPSQLRFELNLERNLIGLYHELRDRRYRPSPSVCFVIEDSVKREVFASDFRDRVVHHLYCNYVAAKFDRLFIHDSYSCRKGKGTLFGIERLEHHIRSCTRNFTRPAYILQLDVQGYFMSIRRDRLREMVIAMLQRCGLTDPLLLWLTDVIILKNPLDGCRRCGRLADWDGLPDSKCLGKQPPGTGLPIGDLTSQLFSNVFLHQLDRFVTHELGFRHYGRYVDDFWLIDTCKERLQAAVKPLQNYLQMLGLTLHPKKIRLMPCTARVYFLGAVCSPYFRHVSARTTRKFRRLLYTEEQKVEYREGNKEVYRERYIASPMEEHRDGYGSAGVCTGIGRQSVCYDALNSYLGYFSHFRTDRFLRLLLLRSPLRKEVQCLSTRSARLGKCICIEPAKAL